MADKFNDGEGQMAKNTVYSLTSKVIAMLLFMISDIIIARKLSYESYGEWTYYYSIAGILYIIARLGINSSSQVFVASRVENKEKKKYIVLSFWIRLLFSLIVGAALLVILPHLAGLLGYPEKYANLKKLFYSLPLLVAGNSMVDYFKSLFVGTCEFKKVFWLTVLEYFGIIFFGVSFVLATESVVLLNVGYSISYFAVSFAGYIMLRNTVEGSVKYKNSEDNSDCIKQILRYAVPVMLTSVVSVLLMDMDTFMLGIMCPKGESGIYSISKSLLTKATNFSLAIANSTMVTFAVVTAENVKVKKKNYNKINIYNLLCLLVICIGFVVAGKYMIKILYGKKYISSVNVLYALLPYFILFSLSVFPATYLNYQQLAQKSLMYNIIMFVFNLTFNLLLIPRYGAIGAAVATSLSIIPYTVLLYIAVYKDFKEKEKSEV